MHTTPKNCRTRISHFLAPAIAMSIAATASADTVVDATWVGLSNSASDVWSNAARWNPQTVPDNGGDTVFDVIINGQGNLGPSLEIPVTLRNLSLLDGGGMSNNHGAPADLTVTDTTTITYHPYNDEKQYGGMEVRVSTYVLGNFTNAANGILTGGVYRIEGAFGYRPAILSWRNADLLENAANLSLFGDTALVDQDTGEDALRHFAVNSGSLDINGGKQLVIDNAFTNTGYIDLIGATPTPEIGSSFITVNGNFTNGGRLEIRAGAAFTVNGNMSNGGDLQLRDAGSTLTVSGTITQTSGTLQLGTIEDFRMTAARIDMAAGTTLGGMGTMFCDLVGRGVLSPGNSPGRITVNGDVAMAATTELQIELAGTTAGTSYDQLVQTAADASDQTTLAGTLELSTLGGYVPAYGVAHRIVSAASLAGTFATVTGVQLTADRSLAVTYDATGVNVTAAVPGDVNLNGGVGFEDLVVLAQKYNLATGQMWSTADFTGDGATDFNDLVVLAQHYNQTVTLGTLTSLGGEGFASDWLLAQSLVPEPTTLLLPLCGLAAFRRRRS